jgi:hypothetical protein
MVLGIKVIKGMVGSKVIKGHMDLVNRGIKVILEWMALGIKVIKENLVHGGIKALLVLEALKWKETFFNYYLLGQTTEASQRSQVVHHIFI